jgi:hypothetical protein
MPKEASPASDEYLGYRAAYGSTIDGVPMLTVEAPIEGRREWRAAFVYVFVAGRFVLAEVRFFPAGDRLAYIASNDDVPRNQPVTLNVGQWSNSAKALRAVRGKGISSRMLREAPYDEIDQAARSIVSHRGVVPLLDAPVRNIWESVIKEQATRPRSAGRDDEFYVGWVLRYLECLEVDTYKPHVLMAERYRDELSSAQQARNLIDAAKARGLVIGVGRGARGARLSSKGREVRDRIEEARL